MLIGMDAFDLSSAALQGLWFVLIGVLWVGFFFLEGFDFGIGMLIPFIGGKSDAKRRVMVNTVGPLWGGNEVWLLTAGGATFAAFPTWYSNLFSILYLPLFLVLVGLIARGISFEYRSMNPGTKWRNNFDSLNMIGSFIVTLVLGVGFANFVRGVPVNTMTQYATLKPDVLSTVDPLAPYAAAFGGLSQGDIFLHRFLGLFSGYALLGGVMLVVLFLAHGAQYLSIKTMDEVGASARKAADVLTPIAAVLMLAFVLWGTAAYSTDNPNTGSWGNVVRWIVGIVSIVVIAAGWFLGKKGRPGLAFIGTGLGIGTWVIYTWVTIYGSLGIGVQADPTKLFFSPIKMGAVNTVLGAVGNATTGWAGGPVSPMTLFASSEMTLGLMRTFAFILVPIVLVYIIWAYWVFRKRLNTVNIPVSGTISQTSVDAANASASATVQEAVTKAATS
ncbi:MAG: cytochrome d ubiquinol oxidase subunit II [Propionibacteriaceae bacterium]|nr:cytochrome d ubiquinol oxidase subunit II [Propionibacteriaceae bacterium]